MDPVFDAVNALYTDADNDPQLRHWFNQLSQYVRKCLVEPGYILEDESTREGRELRKTGKQFFDHKYAAHKDNLFNAIAEFFKAMGTDPVNVRFGEDWKRLTKDVLFDDNGSLEFKPQLWNDIREEILPSLIQQVGYIPIPRIEYTDKQVDLVIENLVLEGTNLLPNIVSLEAHNVRPARSTPSAGDTRLTFSSPFTPSSSSSSRPTRRSATTRRTASASSSSRFRPTCATSASPSRRRLASPSCPTAVSRTFSFRATASRSRSSSPRPASGPTTPSLSSGSTPMVRRRPFLVRGHTLIADPHRSD